MSRLEAVIWDVDGTLADTERDGHLVAFNRAFEAEGLPWRWDESTYCRLLSVTGGRERLLADMAQRPESPASAEERLALALRVHAQKNRHYAEIVQAGQIPLRPGVRQLIEECVARGVRMAIATTTSRTNVDALLLAHFNETRPHCFEHIVCGEDVRLKKPHPEVYLTVLSAMGLKAAQCLALEDSPAGATAARAAGIPVVVTRSACFLEDIFSGVLAIGPHLGEPSGWHPAVRSACARGGVGLDQLQAWHAATSAVTRQG